MKTPQRCKLSFTRPLSEQFLSENAQRFCQRCNPSCLEDIYQSSEMAILLCLDFMKYQIPVSIRNYILNDEVLLSNEKTMKQFANKPGHFTVVIPIPWLFYDASCPSYTFTCI